MKMKKIIFTLMFSLIGIAVSFSQSKGVTIDNALTQAAEKFSSSLKNKTTVAILGISSSYNELSEYMLGELTTDIVQLRKLQVVTRANLDVIKKEMNFQLSGEVSDETMQQLGAKTGAQTVISGSFKPLGTLYVLDIQAFDVTTATIQDTYRSNVVSDETLELLTKKKIVGTSGKIQANDYTAGERLGIGFQNILLGLGSYRNGHCGDGVLMTAAEAVGIVCLSRDAVDVGIYIIGASIAYGFVRPFFYHKNNSVNLSMNIGAIPTAHGVEPGVSYRLSW
ncbi:MAG: hypothetical protein MR771_01925 [Treponema succinifaciens]|uniref:CsgG/HfaB family protein n=1 Tax=Treponema succinifaciens TaxID=167 RepID=UPI002356EA61|nr:CsgG/HfaB family protein [Treponema succinifaciens]MCI6911920.1 hypothetical protein [Treponema succinifaciens]